MKRNLTDIVDAKRGDTQIQKVYRGDILVWEAIPPTPFTFMVDTEIIDANTTDDNSFKIDKNFSPISSTLIKPNGSEVGFSSTYTYKSFVDDGLIELKIFKFNNIAFNDDAIKIKSISNWGDAHIDRSGVFQEAHNLGFCSATDAPKLSASLAFMFYQCYDFDISMDNWDFSPVTHLTFFLTSTSFNHPLNHIDVSNVIDFQLMLAYTPFNQDISDWDVSSGTNFSNFMAGKGAEYSPAYLDAIYNKWSLLNLNPNLSISFGSINYTSSGQPGKDTLVNTHGWTVVDGGQI